MSTGAATAYMWFKSVPTVPSWAGWGVLIVTAIFLLLTLVNYCFRASTNKNIDTQTLKFCVWSLLMFGIIFVEIVVTPQAGGPHHMIMLFPFDLLAGFSAAFLFANTFLGMHRQIIFLEGCVLIIWLASNLRSFEMHFSKFRDMSSFRGRWSPHVELLAAYLNEKAKNADSIYTIDWGIGFQLRALCRPKVGRKVKDSWPAFLGGSPGRPDGAAEIARVFPPEKKALYVSFVPEESVFSQGLQNFETNASAGGQHDKTGLECFPSHCGDLSNIRETGKRRGSTMIHMSIRLRPDFGNDSQRINSDDYGPTETISPSLPTGPHRFSLQVATGIFCFVLALLFYYGAVLRIDFKRTYFLDLGPYPDGVEYFAQANSILKEGAPTIQIGYDKLPSRYPPGYPS